MNLVNTLIPQSMAAFGAICLVLAGLVQFMTPNNNSKWAMWFALLGGMGVGGAFGGALASATAAIAGVSQTASGQLFGVGLAGLIFGGMAFWFWIAASPKKGQGLKANSKAKQVLALLVAAALGSVLVGIPVVYNIVSGIVTKGGPMLANLLI